MTLFVLPGIPDESIADAATAMTKAGPDWAFLCFLLLVICGLAMWTIMWHVPKNNKDWFDRLKDMEIRHAAERAAADKTHERIITKIADDLMQELRDLRSQIQRQHNVDSTGSD